MTASLRKLEVVSMVVFLWKLEVVSMVVFLRKLEVAHLQVWGCLNSYNVQLACVRNFKVVWRFVRALPHRSLWIENKFAMGGLIVWTSVLCAAKYNWVQKLPYLQILARVGDDGTDIWTKFVDWCLGPLTKDLCLLQQCFDIRNQIKIN